MCYGPDVCSVDHGTMISSRDWGQGGRGKGEDGVQAVQIFPKEYRLLLAQLGAWMPIRRSAFLLLGGVDDQLVSVEPTQRCPVSLVHAQPPR